MSWARGEKQFQVKHLSRPPSLLHSHDFCTELRSKLRGSCLRPKRASDTLKILKSKEWGRIAESVEEHAKAMGSASQWRQRQWLHKGQIWQFEIIHLLSWLPYFFAALWAPNNLLKPQVWREDPPLQGWPSVSCLHWCPPFPPLWFCVPDEADQFGTRPTDYLFCSVWVHHRAHILSMWVP